MLRRRSGTLLLAGVLRRQLSDAASFPGGPAPTLHSFLQPSVFTPAPRPPPSTPPEPLRAAAATTTLSDSDLSAAVTSGDPDSAWVTFKSIASGSSILIAPSTAAVLVSLLSEPHNRVSLKRAVAAVLFLLDRRPDALPDAAAAASPLFSALASSGALAPAATLLRAMLRARRFPSFSSWGPQFLSVATCGDHDVFVAFLRLFEENCRIALEEKLDEMKPDLVSCNAVLDGCCRILGSVEEAERVLETMSAVGVMPDAESFGSLAFLYASKGVARRVDEVKKLMDALFPNNKSMFFKNLISGYVKTSRFEYVSPTVVRAVMDVGDVDANVLHDDSKAEVVKCFLDYGRFKEFAALIVRIQEIETSRQSAPVEFSLGAGLMDACVKLGYLDKAHIILEELTAQGAVIGLGVYTAVLKAYCKEQRTAEAAQLVAEISSRGLKLDVGSYDALIDASMTAQDFQSAFALFQEMREAMLPDLKTSYLTIMTGLTENNRPEMMATFLDSVVDDPKIEIATHDWNSIIHAFCKVGRLEDARRAYRRMLFLRFQPNIQTYLSLVNGYTAAGKYFSVLILWTEVSKGFEFNDDLIDAFLYAMVKGGFFDMAMQIVEKAQEQKIFIDKWRHKQAFMETHKKLRVAKMRKRNFHKLEALIAFKSWAGLST